jgi:hypothetical protein
MEISEQQLQKLIQDAVDVAVQQTAENLARTFISMPEARAIARDAVPASLRDLDSTAGSGNVLTLGGNGGAAWGTMKAQVEIRADKIFFGVKCNPTGDDPDLVRIYASEIDGIVVAQTDITVADNDFAYVKRTRTDNTMEILAGASVPEDDADYFYYKLHQFSVVTAGTPPVATASIKKYCRLFSIEGGKIPSNANKSKYMSLSLSDNVGATNDPSKNIWDWMRWA